MFQLMSIASLLPTEHCCEEPVSITLMEMPCGHWGLLLCPLEPPLLQAEQARLFQPLLKELRMEAKRGSRKAMVLPQVGPLCCQGLSVLCLEAEEEELC